MRFLISIAIVILFINTADAQVGFTQEGMASYFADEFEGRTTASGERFSHKKATCAHASIPFGALVKITNLENNLSAIVRVNDRGPFAPDRIIDVSQSVAQRLGMVGKSLTKVLVEVVENNGVSIAKVDSVRPVEPKTSVVGKKEPVKVVVATPKDSKISEIKVEESNSEVELFSVEIEVVKPLGFFVQIGSYKELANVLKIAANIRETTKGKTKIQVATVNGEKIYRLMVGSFNSRSDADVMKTKISKVYKDCFVVELKK